MFPVLINSVRLIAESEQAVGISKALNCIQCIYDSLGAGYLFQISATDQLQVWNYMRLIK